MTGARDIINELRAQARALEERSADDAAMPALCRSLRRGADEIDRLLAELAMLRAFVEIEVTE
ncbi:MULTISPECIES: hypothetical protein [unclassified Paracoccus (in: a-proteobacteria)]|uniref:hypothetical protein n=1 Tax=unclassified Paracoccus (in: a-proteobacteria) TaxID=2688777 RepID=UPI0012B2899E|nr:MULTISPECIES: hypothetical protein [unclassified Paracoccus (in: a-proteobacteria)]UXU74350.1 hypothetical protein GB879_010620 [Paracoccus sp. SMMA_5]UXU80240.1 hypothetical protein GB880_010595 [Paracoccus sp. SMMA_5_TC]